MKKGPLTAFFIFLKEKREVVHNEYPKLSPTELIKLMGIVWKELSEDSKRVYTDCSTKSQEKYRLYLERKTAERSVKLQAIRT